MNTLGIAAGVLIIVGGTYVIYKTGLFKKTCTKLEAVSAAMVKSFMEGYNEAAKASSTG